MTGISYNDSTPSISYGYDDYGARTAMTDGEGAMSYTYNANRQLTSETRTFTGLSGNNYTYNYSYNLGGQLTQANYVAPSFNKQVNYAYNATGALTGIGTNLIGSDPNATTNVISALSYRAFGAASSVSYGNNRTATLSYSTDLMRLTQMKLARPDGTDKLVEQGYSYTENGLLSAIGNTVDSAYAMGYEYNYRNQLTKAYRTGSTKTYGLDDWGNLTSVWDYPSSYSATFSYATGAGYVPTTNRLSSMTANGNTTNFSYDSAGNMTAAGGTTYAWDAANRLKSVNSGSLGSYGYDGNGKRVKKSESGTTTYYVISSVLGSAMEVTSAGVQRAYVMNGGSVVAQLNPNGNFYWLHLDHLGSGRKMTDSSGNMTYRAEFDPYGKLLYEWSSPSNLNTKKFTGYERDAATNLDYAQARMYASDWGRFMTPDPAGLRAARLTSPKSFNRYAYTEGNPINYRDPSGLGIFSWLGRFWGWLNQEREGPPRNLYDELPHLLDGGPIVQPVEWGEVPVVLPEPHVIPPYVGRTVPGRNVKGPKICPPNPGQLSKVDHYLALSGLAGTIDGAVTTIAQNGNGYHLVFKDLAAAAAALKILGNKDYWAGGSFGGALHADELKSLFGLDDAEFTDYRSFNGGNTLLGDLSMQVTLIKSNGQVLGAYVDVDKFNFRQDLVGTIGHIGELVKHSLSKLFGDDCP